MISPEEFVERLCRLGADRGPRRFPRKQRDRERNKDRQLRIANLFKTHRKPSPQNKPNRLPLPPTSSRPSEKYPPPADPESPTALAAIAKLKKMFNIK